MNPLCHEWKVLVVILESIKVHEEMCNTGILSSAIPSNTLRLNFLLSYFLKNFLWNMVVCPRCLLFWW